MPDTRLYHVGLALQKMAANYIESIDQDRDLRLLISFLSKRLGKPATRPILDDRQVVYLAKAFSYDELSH